MIEKSPLSPRKKAVVLLSGGLDSALAAALLVKQGVDVEAVFFRLPFYPPSMEERCHATEVARELGIKLKTVTKDREFIQIVRKPKHGYGRGLNPCIDCKILMLKEAKRYAEKIGASFIATGEVLGERPMSQHRRALEIIERETGLKGRILRPLSAKLLPKTDVEKDGTIEREKLLDIVGRQRKRQLETAKILGVTRYASPAGGCLLTDKYFSRRLRDLLRNCDRVTARDIRLLKIGRHFRYGSNKIVVGRNEEENRLLLSLKRKSEYHFEVVGCGSPVTLLQGPVSKAAVNMAAALTAHYSDSEDNPTTVMYGKKELNKKIDVSPTSEDDVSRLRI
ncbi:MAG: asparagine synthase-related protein [Candidatus Bathyarchaeia archaeon]